MPAPEMSREAMIKEIEKQFGSRVGFLGYEILMLSMTGQPCDVTFYGRNPALDVKIDQSIGLAIMYGAGPKKLQQMLSNIHLSDGQTVSISDIWVIHPMPAGGTSEEDLAAVDLSEGEKKIGPKGETLREMIRETYKCKTKEDEDKFIRRWVAS
jgi:hypothetical protein